MANLLSLLDVFKYLSRKEHLWKLTHQKRIIGPLNPKHYSVVKEHYY